MRLRFFVPAVAASLLCFASALPAQSNWPGTLPPMSDSRTGSRLGVALRDIDPDRANVIKLGDTRGVEVVGVEESSPAEQAGIKSGDVLLVYNGETIVGAQQLGRLVAETPRGRKVKIEYWREGRVSTITATTAAPRAMSFPGLAPEEMPDIRLTLGPIPMPGLIWRDQRLGIEWEFLDSQLADYFGVRHGALVRAVAKESPAAKSGLRAGDVVTQMGDHAVSDAKDIGFYSRSGQRAPVLSLQLTREHKPMTLKVKLGQDE
jgi:serine protease Do